MSVAPLTPKQIREILEEYLHVLYPKVTGLEITFLVKDKSTNAWKANVTFYKNPTDFFTYKAMVLIEANGDITQFKEGWYWQY